jgi:hypothetical protein
VKNLTDADLIALTLLSAVVGCLAIGAFTVGVAFGRWLLAL